MATNGLAALLRLEECRFFMKNSLTSWSTCILVPACMSQGSVVLMPNVAAVLDDMHEARGAREAASRFTSELSRGNPATTGSVYLRECLN
jgi:hypothetical protein